MSTIQMMTWYDMLGTNTLTNIVISKDVANVNIKDILLSLGWNGTTPLTTTVRILAGVTVTSNSTSTYAFETGSGYPVGASIILINDGTIVGRGGNGGNSVWIEPLSTSNNNGSAGGPGARIQVATSITNNGILAGGGGGGGAGGNTKLASGTDISYRSMGGSGGGGVALGAGGVTIKASLSGEPGGGGKYYGANGSDATLSKNGSGGNGGRGAGKGGNGGSYGAAGQHGGSGYNYAADYATDGGSGGAAGACLSGVSLVTWVLQGNTYGSIS